MKTPASRRRDKGLSFISRLWKRLTEAQQFWLAFSIFVLLTTILIHNPFWRTSGAQTYREGDIARESIIAPVDIVFTDDDETSRRREEAKKAVRPIFRYESNKPEQAIQRFLSSWEKLQRHSSEGAANKQSNTAEKTETHWTGAGGAEVGNVLASRQFSRNELEAVQSALREASQGYIFDDSERQYFQNEVFVFDRSRPNIRTTVSMPESIWCAM